MIKHELQTSSQSRVGLLLLPVLLLSGCTPINWIKDKLNTGKSNVDVTSTQDIVLADDGSTVLATMQGQPIVTVKSLDEDLEKLMTQRPEIRQMLPLMPNLKPDFLKGLVSQKVVDHFITVNKIDTSSEYQKELAQAINSLKLMLNAKYFNQQFPVNISDAEIQKFYDENKTQMKDLLLSNGGIQAYGISAGSQAEAKQIAEAAKDKTLSQVANTLGKKANFQDFKLVHKDSAGIDSALKSKIISIKKFPTTEIVKASDGTFWVISATSSQEPKYRPFEQVKEALRQYVEQEKRMEKMSSEIDRLSKEYGIVINEDYFNKGKKDSEKEDGAEPRMADASQPCEEVAAARVA